MASDWECVPRSYEITKNHLQRQQIFDHPLKIHTVTVVDSKGTRANVRGTLGSHPDSRKSSNVSLLSDPLGSALDGQDPLSQFARQEKELIDPLSQMMTEHAFQKKSKALEKDANDEEALNWASRRLAILNRFTTNEKLSIFTSFLTAGATGAVESTIIRSQTVVADKVKYRLEQLDNFEESSMRMMDLTQSEYIQRIEQLNQELVESWNSDQRVKALKICIQCAKLLSDNSVLQFYPSQFVLVTDILDMFGKLVFKRLQSKAYNSCEGGKNVKSPQAMLNSAKETCMNWYYKIASIKELLPRLYVEIAIIKCYEFQPNFVMEETLMRLTKIIRGIADPLVSIYLRCYLVRVGLTVTKNKEFIMENLKDFLLIYHTIFTPTTRAELNRQQIDMTTYLGLYAPAIDFILQALVYQNNICMKEVLQNFEEIRNNGALLLSLLNSFTSEFVAANALDLANVLSSSSTDGISKGQLFRALGNHVSHCAPLYSKTAILQTSFNMINTFTDPGEYITTVETWAQFIAENFTMLELNEFLGNVIRRLSMGKAYDKFSLHLQNVLYKIMENNKEIDQLLVQENFLPYLDLFHKESIKVDVCKTILSHFKRNGHDATSDSIVINALMYIGKILNDTVTAQTVEDERRQISNLISSFIRKVDFGADFERQLSFYVEARGSFANLDAVYTTLVYAVNKLASETRRLVNGKHNRKTGAFVKACIAYCFITIPSISTVYVQMDLYLLTGQVALLNLCLGQADSCFEATLNLVAELPRSIEVEGKLKSMESYLVSYLCNMLATLVVVPDSPEQGVLFLLRLLIEALKKFPFDLHSSGPSQVLLHALDMLYVQSLEEFPYHLPDVISNDELYGQDPKFLAEVNALCGNVVDQILAQLKALGAAQQFRTQALLTLELFVRIVRYADLSKERTFQLTVNLWLLAKKLENYVEQKLLVHSMRSIEEIYKLCKDADPQRAQRLTQLIARMKANK